METKCKAWGEEDDYANIYAVTGNFDYIVEQKFCLENWRTGIGERRLTREMGGVIGWACIRQGKRIMREGR